MDRHTEQHDSNSRSGDPYRGGRRDGSGRGGTGSGGTGSGGTRSGGAAPGGTGEPAHEEYRPPGPARAGDRGGTPAPGGGRPVVTETVDVPVGTGTMALHVARPAAGGGPWPAVVVGFELFGATGYILRTAARLAAAGLVAVVPDFHHRTAPGFAAAADDAGRAQGFALLERLQRREVREDLLAVLGHLEQRQDTTARTGMVGLSVGGHLAYFAASQVPLAAVAAVYPGWLDTPGTALSRPGPLLDLTPGIAGHGTEVLYLAGADDHLVTADQNRRTGEALAAAGVRHEIVVYPGTPHGFLADERASFRPGPAEDAWRRIEALLAVGPAAAG